MPCQLCRNLETEYKAKQIEYNEASSLACHLISKKFAAYLNVEMERAKAEFEEHRLVCLSAANESAHSPLVTPLSLAQQEKFRSGTVPTAA